jgi:hypothetical protein
MAWNLAFDHLLTWILSDSNRTATFNSGMHKRFPKKLGLVIAGKEDFEELKESEVLQVCASASLFSKNMGRILEEKLKKRNMAAHPSSVEVQRSQAEDVITDLTNNIILKLVGTQSVEAER